MTGTRPRMLITGTGSGLGRHLHERLGGDALSRAHRSCAGDTGKTQPDAEPYDVVVHCASNPAKDLPAEALYDYLNDNVLLTERLTRICRGKFILMSSISVYPPGSHAHREDDPISVDGVRGIYGISKLMSEAIVRRRCADHLVLRLSSLVGRYARNNSTFKILRGVADSLPLSGESRMIYVRYEDVEAFIEAALKRDLQGVYNIASSDSIRLADVARLVGREISFGPRLYDPGVVDNQKAASIVPALKCGSVEMLNRYLADAR